MEISKIEKDIIPLEDGYFYFAPSSGGAISSRELRQIADYLDEKNTKWDDDVNNYFNMKKK